MSKVRIRKGVAAVIFRIPAGRKEPEFLILHRIKRWRGWEMLKGGRRGREKPLDTLRREMMEELGAPNFEVVAKVPFTLYFKIDKKNVREIGFTHMKFPVYLVKYDGIISLESNQSKEHDAYKWAKFREAMRLLTFNTSRNELKAAYKLIKSKRLAEII